MTAEQVHIATRTEIEVFWADGLDVTLGTHHRSACECPTAEQLIDADLIHDAVLVEDEEPVRTETACNAIGCQCTELAEGRPIGNYPSCAICSHTTYSHQPRKQGKQVRRS